MKKVFKTKDVALSEFILNRIWSIAFMYFLDVFFADY